MAGRHRGERYRGPGALLWRDPRRAWRDLPERIAAEALPYDRDGRRTPLSSWDARLFLLLISALPGGPLLIHASLRPGSEWTWWQRALGVPGGITALTLGILAAVGTRRLLARRRSR